MPLVALAAIACAPESLDERLRGVLAAEGIAPLDYRTSPHPKLVALGRALFYDKELSGNRDVACGTCHHLGSRTSDDLSLSIGTGGTGVGRSRTLGEGRDYLQRNAPELFSRGVEDWQVMGWGARLRLGEPWPLPDDVRMPAAIDDDLLAAQVMLHVTERNAMRGIPGDFDVHGDENTLAYWPDDDLPAIWDDLLERLLAIDAYEQLFADAFPDVSRGALGFEHAALGLSAYVADAFSMSESPWDLYVAGDDAALVEPAKRGALLFFGAAGCGECHAGSLLTDQLPHDICAPQLGLTEDRGAAAHTREHADRYAFRTPPLRNVSFTGPYLHAGTHSTLEGVLRHHLDACANLRRYVAGGGDADLEPRFSELLLRDDALLAEIEATADPMAVEGIELGTEQVADLLQFLEALSDPDVVDMAWLRPNAVPSGLPVD